MTAVARIGENWRTVDARVAAACQRAGRPRGEVTVVAVSKTQPIEAVCAVAAAGATDFGENYAQELAVKRAALSDVRWHFIGHLQRNKAKLVAGQVVLVHAVDTIALGEELAKRAPTVQPILLVVNLGGEATKTGVTSETAPAVARSLAAIANLRLDGLMTLPPPSDDPEASRPCFEQLRALRDRLEQELGRALPVLSMGMSGDFEVAIDCGATHVRIGTAIFGTRV